MNSCQILPLRRCDSLYHRVGLAALLFRCRDRRLTRSVVEMALAIHRCVCSKPALPLPALAVMPLLELVLTSITPPWSTWPWNQEVWVCPRLCRCFSSYIILTTKRQFSTTRDTLEEMWLPAEEGNEVPTLYLKSQNYWKMQYNNFSGHLQNLTHTLCCVITTCLRSPSQKGKQNFRNYSKLKKPGLDN